ncbi:MAG: hypothetical protein DGJ47_001135 [Rickettsiaceae bacterium]
MRNRNAIIDIGYNAIRAVVYESEQAGAPEIFSNKFKSDIASLLSDDFNIKHPSYLSIQYLINIFKKLEVTKIHCVATEVLRNHSRAQEFIEYIKDKYGLNIKIISGQEEAQLTALGLVHGIQDCDGIAADLGGGSLELVEVKDSTIGSLASLQLGTKAITSRNITSCEEIIDLIIAEYGQHEYENLYLIGGALRFIGRLYLDFIRHPMKNLHHLEIDTNDFLNYLDDILESQSQHGNKIGKRRINSNAILVAKSMIEVFKPKKIIISTYGLKEGVRFQLLNLPDHNIIDAKIAYACNFNLEKLNIQSYLSILEKIIPWDKKISTLLKLSIILTSLKKNFDKTLPPSALTEYILTAEIPLKPQMRIMLTLIANISSDFRINPEIIKISKQLISKEEYTICQIIGHLIAIAELADGPQFSTPSFDIKVKNDYYEIVYEGILPRPIFDKICYRLKSMSYAKKQL